ncbi:MAG: 4Fe-4S dicluster domain-containing protein [SAR324 cluster bacterium]|nr:4Fe-4S dicluster domain-containing protein [SAR324 cluster bacterium]
MTENRRKFLKKSAGVIAGAGVVSGFISKYATGFADAATEKAVTKKKIRWGMVIDMRKCVSGCEKCIDACHLTHNVPDFDNPKDEIKWIWKSDYHKVFPSKSQQFVAAETREKPFLTLCNHCENPPCVKACPTGATFKQSDGIVEMDFHRCIGCRFCMAACPYGSRSFNWRNPRPAIKNITPDYPTREHGVVEKCNFCSERLAKGQQPSCVEACPEKVLTFGNLYDKNSEIRQVLKDNPTIQRKPELGTNPSVFYIT